MPNGKEYHVLDRTGTNQVLILFNSVPIIYSNHFEGHKKLAELREQGYLTKEEFQIKNIG